jgi:predicted transcriptional regulator
MPAEELLLFFKAMADENRLKIVGLLAQHPLSVEQISEILALRPSTVSHHLSKLAEAGLVSARAESYYNIYQLETNALEAMTRRMLSRETFSLVTSGINMDAYDHKVVADYLLADGHLKTIPSQRKKLEAILHHIIEAFKPGEHYSEKQVNEILMRFHKDTASLRRELVGFRLLARTSSGDNYWRIIKDEVKEEKSDE